MAVPKKRKRRQMSEEQRQAAAERLAVARKKRLKANPPSYKNIHPNVVALDEKQMFSMVNVRKWIATQKELIVSYRKEVKQNIKGAESRLANAEAYVRNAEHYLKTGLWVDMFYGEHMDRKLSTIRFADGTFTTGFYEAPPVENC